MKQKIKSILILSIALVSIALVSNAAYSNPTTSPTGNNNELVPIDVSENDQVKSGGLSVGAFHSIGFTEVIGTTIFSDFVRGSNQTVQNSTVNISSTYNEVGVETSGQIKIDDTITVNDLSGSGTRRICANTEGKLIVCP